MHETPADLERLANLLEQSMATAGPHLRSIITDDRRMTADEVCDHLQGMCLLVLATVTADGRPLAGPVDGIFYRGLFHFSSSSDSVRFAHLKHRPWVSASHLPREELAVTVHGRAAWVDHHDPEHAEFRRTLLDVYTPRYGDEWESFLDSIPSYVRIDADRMFTLLMR